jgi:hypothetical protein
MDPRARTKLGVAGAATFAALLASYSAFRPVRDALILDRNPDSLPWLWLGTFVVISIVSPGARCSRVARRAASSPWRSTCSPPARSCSSR